MSLAVVTFEETEASEGRPSSHWPGTSPAGNIQGSQCSEMPGSGREVSKANTPCAGLSARVPPDTTRIGPESSKEIRQYVISTGHVISSAGVMVVLVGLTTDGYEIQFGVDHVGHALLIKLILPVMLHILVEPNGDVLIVP